ncbi:hypothetical protein DRP05_06780 [Archaeoglobales archaeon]|nr:MAG: hypothetical protein DRP05_06780 [Archaeoglobales archaeon]
MYQILYDKWKLQIFANIAKLENLQIRNFKHNKLVEEGSKSIENALKIDRKRHTFLNFLMSEIHMYFKHYS